MICNTPDCKSAERIAEKLLAARAAACVNILPACRSIYRWQGKVESEPETPMFIKTTAARFALASDIIAQYHPAAVPEIIAADIVAGLPAYLNWVVEQCED